MMNAARARSAISSTLGRGGRPVALLMLPARDPCKPAACLLTCFVSTHNPWRTGMPALPWADMQLHSGLTFARGSSTTWTLCLRSTRWLTFSRLLMAGGRPRMLPSRCVLLKLPPADLMRPRAAASLAGLGNFHTCMALTHASSSFPSCLGQQLRVSRVYCACQQCLFTGSWCGRCLGVRVTSRKASPMFLLAAPPCMWTSECTILAIELTNSMMSSCQSGRKVKQVKKSYAEPQHFFAQPSSAISHHKRNSGSYLQHFCRVRELPDVAEAEYGGDLVAWYHGVDVAAALDVIGYDLRTSIAKANRQQAASMHKLSCYASVWAPNQLLVVGTKGVSTTSLAETLPAYLVQCILQLPRLQLLLLRLGLDLGVLGQRVQRHLLHLKMARQLPQC